jgi:hypothetical protein
MMTDYAKGYKKVPFDGTEENLYLWTTALPQHTIASKQY